MSDDARASGLQVFQFSTASYRPHVRIAAWREVFGRAMVNRYVMEQRLAAAHKALVARPDATISSIAYDAGFNDIANFNRVFRQHFGCTPSDVRKAAVSRDDGA
jgi:AraC-like DNA-binding protein